MRVPIRAAQIKAYEAVEVGGGDAEHNQREHVELVLK